MNGNGMSRSYQKRSARGDGLEPTSSLAPVKCACGRHVELTCGGGHDVVLDIDGELAAQTARAKLRPIAPRPTRQEVQERGTRRVGDHGTRKTRERLLALLRVGEELGGRFATRTSREWAKLCGEDTVNGRVRIHLMLGALHREGVVARHEAPVSATGSARFGITWSLVSSPQDATGTGTDG